MSLEIRRRPEGLLAVEPFGRRVEVCTGASLEANDGWFVMRDRVDRVEELATAESSSSNRLEPDERASCLADRSLVLTLFFFCGPSRCLFSREPSRLLLGLAASRLFCDASLLRFFLRLSFPSFFLSSPVLLFDSSAFLDLGNSPLLCFFLLATSFLLLEDSSTLGLSAGTPGTFA